MKRRMFTSLLLVALATFAPARTKNPPLDPDYVSALATANDFLHAWQIQDQETATLLLSDRLKQRTNEQTLNSFFPGGGSRRQSFEIGRGKKLAAGRYQFPISLFQRPTKHAPKTTRPLTSALVVVKEGKNDWAIDNLP